MMADAESAVQPIRQIRGVGYDDVRVRLRNLLDLRHSGAQHGQPGRQVLEALERADATGVLVDRVRDQPDGAGPGALGELLGGEDGEIARAERLQPAKLRSETSAAGPERTGQQQLATVAQAGRDVLEQRHVQLVYRKVPGEQDRWAPFGSRTTRGKPTARRCSSTARLVAMATTSRDESSRSPWATATASTPGKVPSRSTQW